MQTFAILALASSVAAQAVTSKIYAPGSTPDGAATSVPYQFEISDVVPSGLVNANPATASSCGQTGILTIGLSNGVLTDNLGRTGYIVSNNSQFQFDKPPQAGAEYTAGFSILKNGSLALGNTAIFYSCNSGNIYNLYFQSQGAQCQVINIDTVPCASSSSSAASSATVATASEATDGQPQATAGASSVSAVSEYTDGQPQATISASSVAAVSEYTDGQPQATASAGFVSEFTDGQPQATNNASMVAKPTIVPAAAASFATPAVMAVAGAIAAAFL